MDAQTMADEIKSDIRSGRVNPARLRSALTKLVEAMRDDAACGNDDQLLRLEELHRDIGGVAEMREVQG